MNQPRTFRDQPVGPTGGTGGFASGSRSGTKSGEPRRKPGLTCGNAGGRYWDRTNDFFGVKAASSLYSVSGRRGRYVVTWEYMSGWASSCWWSLEGMFPPCSFSDRAINLIWLAEDPFATKVGGHRPRDPQSALDGPAGTVTCREEFGTMLSRVPRSVGVAVRPRRHRRAVEPST